MNTTTNPGNLKSVYLDKYVKKCRFFTKTKLFYLSI